MNTQNFSTDKVRLISWSWIQAESPIPSATISSPVSAPSHQRPDNFIFKALRHWLETIDVCQPQRAHWICQLIPSRCPFEREVKWFGKTLFSIPPLCQLNPLYEDIVALRFRALCYLADVCGEDVTQYC